MKPPEKSRFGCVCGRWPWSTARRAAGEEQHFYSSHGAAGTSRGRGVHAQPAALARRRALLLFLGMSSSVCAESLVSRSPRMKGIVKGLSRAPLVARWPAELYSSLMSVARLELHCRWGSVGGKDAAAQGSMAGGAQARALACGAAGMSDGGRSPVAGRIDAQRRPEEASAGVSCLPRPSDIFETRADLAHLMDEYARRSILRLPY